MGPCRNPDPQGPGQGPIQEATTPQLGTVYPEMEAGGMEDPRPHPLDMGLMIEGAIMGGPQQTSPLITTSCPRSESTAEKQFGFTGSAISFGRLKAVKFLRLYAP